MYKYDLHLQLIANITHYKLLTNNIDDKSKTTIETNPIF